MNGHQQGAGGPPDPGAEKRVLLAFVLTFLVIALMQPLVSRYARQQQPAPAPQEPAKPATPPPPQPQQPAPPAAKATRTPKAMRTPAAPVTAKQSAAEAETVVENDLYRIVFTNRGALVKSWVLKKYNDDKGKPLELVHTLAAGQHGYPLALWPYDLALRQKVNSVLYVPSAQGALSVPGQLTFEYADGQMVVRKVLSFDHSYVVHVETSLAENGSAVQAYPAWPAGFGDQTTPASYGAAHVVWEYRDKLERVEPKKVSGGNTLSGPFQWAGVTDQYFAAVFLPDEPESAAMITLHSPVNIPKNADQPGSTETVEVHVLGAAVGNRQGPTRTRLFVGPKAVEVLDAIHAAPAGGAAPDLAGLVDFGKWFGWLARPLFLWLKWTHEHWVRNWGWAIMVLTVIINVALFPLRLTQMKSALKMQKAQPQLKAIQEKYKKYPMRDPRRQDMNKEMQELYKREGINPAGGCLPLVLQMPFLIAFYSMLGVTIELRHATWLWIRDLSAPDPWHLLPIAIMISMFYLQRLTPAAGMDPMQQKMMTVMMPVMIGALSWTLASGLGLYWTMGNVIAIVQQHLVNRSQFGREMRAEMEKRAAKKKAKS